MSPRDRILAYGAATAMVLGGLGAAVAGGLVGQALAIALITLGLGGALLLVFFEVGLSEERDQAREDERRRHEGGDAANAGSRGVERPILGRGPQQGKVTREHDGDSLGRRRQR